MPTDFKSAFTGHCRTCKQPLDRGLWCPKCVAVESVARRMEDVSGLGQEALTYFDETLDRFANWTDVLAFVETRGGPEKLWKLYELACDARYWFQGTYSPWFPRKDENKPAIRERYAAMHAPGWARAKDRARARIEEGIELGKGSDAWQEQCAAFFRWLRTGILPANKQ